MRQCSCAFLIVMAFSFGCGDSRQIDSDSVGPRATEFKPDVSFAVCMRTKSAGPLTIDRVSPFAPDESLFLMQPPILTRRDVRAVSIEEAPGQWASLTVQFHQNAAENFTATMKNEGCEFAILINDKIVAIQSQADVQNTTSLSVRESFSVPDIRSAVK
jgi:hypothetical protein